MLLARKVFIKFFANLYNICYTICIEGVYNGFCQLSKIYPRNAEPNTNRISPTAKCFLCHSQSLGKQDIQAKCISTKGNKRFL